MKSTFVTSFFSTPSINLWLKLKAKMRLKIGMNSFISVSIFAFDLNV